MKIQLTFKPIQVICSLFELFRTGGIQTTAKGDKILVNIRGNMAGDVLVFIGPKESKPMAYAEVLELVRNDTLLSQAGREAMNVMRQKYKGLAFLPLAIVWILNIVILYYSFYKPYFNSVCDLIRFGNYPSNFVSYLPLILPILTRFWGKPVGFVFLKPIAFLVIKIIRFFRSVRNRTVEQMQPGNSLKLRVPLQSTGI
jgi:hypothetical protein